MINEDRVIETAVIETAQSGLSRRGFLKAGALATAGIAGSGALLTACGGGNQPAPGNQASAGGISGKLTWSASANPGEADRFRAYTKDWNGKTGVDATFQAVTGDYLAKLLTQLAGNSAPDNFYAGDVELSKLVSSNALQPLDEFLASPEATTKFTDHFSGLTAWMKGADGKVYGLPNDCNPIVLWFNKNVLKEAGVEQDPAQMFEAGTWTKEAYNELLTKVKATGKSGGVVETGWWGFWMGYIAAQGGTLFDESGKAVFDTDAKSQAALEWLLEELKSENLKFGGALPKGQGVDALFYAGQLATMAYGRWVLPNLRKVKANVDYDIAPLPVEDGKTVPKVPVGTSAMVVNAKSKNLSAALRFATDYVNKDGQRYRLSGGGNALPTLPGLEDIATENNDPPHGGLFNEEAKIGWGTPKPLYSDAEKGANLSNEVTKLLLPDAIGSTTAKSFADTICKFLNA